MGEKRIRVDWLGNWSEQAIASASPTTLRDAETTSATLDTGAPGSWRRRTPPGIRPTPASPAEANAMAISQLWGRHMSMSENPDLHENMSLPSALADNHNRVMFTGYRDDDNELNMQFQGSRREVRLALKQALLDLEMLDVDF